MSVWVYTVMRDEKDLLGYFLRHYSAFCSRIIIYDDDSTDGSLDMMRANPAVEIRQWVHRHYLDDIALKDLSESVYKEARGQADWVIWADIDEFYYAPQMCDMLTKTLIEGYDAPRVEGWNMMNEGLPKDDGKTPLTDLIKKGVRAPVHDKQVVFRPECEMHWSTGRHHLECNLKVTLEVRVKNLHYRFLGYDYTRARNLRNLDRLYDKAHGWSNQPSWKGEHSPEWAQGALKDAVPVIE